MVDISGLTTDELLVLASQVSARYAEKQREEQEAEIDRKQEITNAIASLNALLGPADAVPYVPGETPPSIRALLLYTPEVLASASGLVLQLLLQGMQELVLINLNLAHVVGSTD